MAVWPEVWREVIASVIFLGVLTLIATERLQTTVAAFLGAMLLIFLNVLTLDQAIDYISKSYATLAMFFGVMVMVRTFEPTQIFAYLAARMVVMAEGQGKRLLLGIVAIATPVCALLPNATTVMLIAPLIPTIAEELNISFVPLLILLVFVANSAGLLTLVGDPATFIVGSAINMSFVDYLWQVSLGGAIAIGTIVVLLPVFFPQIWRLQLADLSHLPQPVIKHPRFLVLGGVIVALVLGLFVVGETLPVPISPAAIALLGAALCLLLAHHSGVDSVTHILRDLDWSTLIFFMSVFVLVGGLQATGVISAAAQYLGLVIGQDVKLGAIILLLLTGILSSLIPNIPLVVAMVPLLKEYVVSVGLAGPELLSPDFVGQVPAAVLPLFVAMMFGATLGGNGTLVGASSNMVAAGIAEQHGQPISFHLFLKYGLPLMSIQILVIAVYVGVRFLL